VTGIVTVEVTASAVTLV